MEAGLDTALLLAPAFLILFVLGRWIARAPFQLIVFSTGVALTMDALVFVHGAFAISPHASAILLTGIAAKLVVGSFYLAALAGYLRFLDTRDAMTYRERFEALQQQSMRDPLTGLFHKGVFESVIGAQLARASRSGRNVSLLMVDVDRFKLVNDELGHREGDEVLRAVARALQGVVRASDFACRFGGEEFAILLPDTELRDALALAERVREAVTCECRACTVAGAIQPITVSIGLAAAPTEAASPEALIEIADRRLYDAKHAGRNRTTSTGSPRRHLHVA